MKRNIDLFKKLRPKFAKTLAKGLTLSEIQKQELRFGTTLPPEIVELYQSANGQIEGSTESFYFEYFLLPLEAAVDRAIELRSAYSEKELIQNYWNTQWLPILDNGEGDHLVIDLAGIADGDSGQIVSYFTEWEDRSVDFPDLPTFFQILIESWSTDPWIWDDDYGYSPKFLELWELFLEEKLPQYPLDYSAGT